MPQITPNYGSLINFAVSSFDLENNDGYIWRGFDGTNPIEVGLDIAINNMTSQEVENAIDAINTISGETYFIFEDDSNFFKNMEFSFDDFRVDFSAKNAYNAKVRFSQKNESIDLSTYNKFLKDDFIRLYGTGTQYFDGDVVYDETKAVVVVSTGGIGFLSGTSKDCYYYCTKTHISSGAITGNPNFVQHILPIEVEEDSYYEYRSAEQPLKFIGSFDQRVGMSSLTNRRISPINMSFQNLDDRKAKQILHFCEHHAGPKRFGVNIPTGINRDGNSFMVSNWSQRWNYEDSNTVSISLVQDVMVKEGRRQVSLPDNRILSPNFLLKNGYFLNPSFVTSTGVSGKVTSIQAASATGFVDNIGSLTNDNFRYQSGLLTRPSKPVGFELNGGFRFTEFFNGAYTVSYLIKPSTTGTHETSWIFGDVASVRISGGNVSIGYGEVRSPQIPWQSGDWMAISVKGNEASDTLSAHINTNRGSAKITKNFNYSDLQTKIILFPFHFTLANTFVGDVKFAAMYYEEISDDDANGLGTYLLGRV